MIVLMGKLKANFVQAMRRLVNRRIHPHHHREAISSSADTGAASRHPLFGALKGLVRVMPGTDLTEPADPAWGSD
jgi:hypothetical protein